MHLLTNYFSLSFYLLLLLIGCEGGNGCFDRNQSIKIRMPSSILHPISIWIKFHLICCREFFGRRISWKTIMIAKMLNVCNIRIRSKWSNCCLMLKPNVTHTYRWKRKNRMQHKKHKLTKRNKKEKKTNLDRVTSLLSVYFTQQKLNGRRHMFDKR